VSTRPPESSDTDENYRMFVKMFKYDERKNEFKHQKEISSYTTNITKDDGHTPQDLCDNIV